MGYYNTPEIAVLADVQSVEKTPTETFHRRGEPSASVRLWCNYAYCKLVIWDLLQPEPKPHPKYPDLYVNTVTATYDGVTEYSDVQEIWYEKAILDVQYTPLEAGEYTETISNIISGSKLPTHMFRWKDEAKSPVKQGEEPSRISGMQKVVHTYTMIPELLEDFLLKQGHVNSEPLENSQELTYEPGTLLYLNYDSSRVWDRFGTLGWQVTVNFMYNPIGWNVWLSNYSEEPIGMEKWNPMGDSGTSKPGAWEDHTMYQETELEDIFHYDPEREPDEQPEPLPEPDDGEEPDGDDEPEPLPGPDDGEEPDGDDEP